MNTEILQHLTNLFIIHKLSMKLYVYKTNKYKIFKITKKYLESFYELYDKFVEICKGHLLDGEILVKNKVFDIRYLNDDLIVDYIKSFLKVINDVKASMFNDVSILNVNVILDDMGLSLAKLLYLLKLQ